MGKSVVCHYVVRTWEGLNVYDIPSYTMPWNTEKPYGMRPTDANLEKWIVSYNESFKVGGINHDVSIMKGVIVHAHRADIYNQKTGTIVATWKAPMFEEI
jgi:hypothetical protein